MSSILFLAEHIDEISQRNSAPAEIAASGVLDSQIRY